MDTQIPGADQVRKALQKALSTTTQAQFARTHSITQGYVSAVLSGRQPPGDEICEAVGYERVVNIRYRRKS